MLISPSQTSPVYELLDRGEHNVYHFLFYTLARLITLNNITLKTSYILKIPYTLYKIIFDNTIIHYYYPNSKNCKISEGFLELLPSCYVRYTALSNISGTQPKGTEGNIEFTQIDPLPCFMESIPNEAYFFIRQLFSPYISNKLYNEKYVYVSRNINNCSIRTIINEDEIIPILDKLNIRTVYMENLTIKEQIELFSSSKLIISPHGAGLSFATFSHQYHTVICEINPNLEYKNHYRHLCNSLMIPYVRFDKCVSMNNHIYIDVPLFEIYVTELLLNLNKHCFELSL